MEIRIRRQLTGAQMRADILAKYGTQEKAAKKAKAGDAEAKDAVFNLRLFAEEPKRLEQDLRVENVLTLDQKDLSRLTWTRLQVLETLRSLGTANLRELTDALGRDPKNVSEDVACLVEYGLISGRRVGREKRLRPAGNQILIEI